MAELAALADRYGFRILEDASHAVGASYAGVPVGSCHHSAITVFSFHPVKIITTGEGGAALSRDPELVERLQRLRSHGISREAFEAGLSWALVLRAAGAGVQLQAHGSAGQPRPQPTAAACEIVDRRQALMARYRQLVQGWPLRFLEEPANCRSSYHLAVVTIPDASPISTAPCLRACGLLRLACNCTTGRFRCNLITGDWDSSLATSLWLSAMPTPASSLPLFPGMTDADQDRVLATLGALLKQQGLA